MTSNPNQARPRQLWIVLGIVAVAVVVLGSAVAGVGIWLVTRNDAFPPSGWHQRSFTVAISQGEIGKSLREDAARLLEQQVRDAGVDEVVTRADSNTVDIAVPMNDRGVLDGLGVVTPQIELREIVKETPVTGNCEGTCSADKKFSYELGPVIVDGTHVRSAEASAGQSADWTVSVSFEPAGQEAFSAATQRLTGQRIAIAISVDGTWTVISAPEVQGAITGDVQIAGNLTASQAANMAGVFRLASVGATVSPQ